MNTWPASIVKLRSILSERKDLTVALQTSIQQAGITEVPDMNHFVIMLMRMLTEAPTRQRMNDDLGYFHYLTSSSPDDLLYQDPLFSKWLCEFAAERGSFLDTTASTAGLDTFTNDPSFHIHEYDPGPGGWLTFNQFFTRHVRPGKRPVEELCNDQIIVAATDGKYLGCWPIDQNTIISSKGDRYTIPELLKDSRYKDEFNNGIFTHTYLDTNDYHRYHVPVRATVRETKRISGKVTADTVKDADGSYITKDEIGFQFSQTRGVMILETPIGLVAMIPVGMGHVSSVNFTADVDSTLRKGEEFGYFAYGGSDMIILFQTSDITLTAIPGKHYCQGQSIGHTQ